MATAASETQGIQVLTVPHVHVDQLYENERVELASDSLNVLLVTIPLDDALYSSDATFKQETDDSTDLWLVLAVGDDFSLPVPATQRILPDRTDRTHTYVFPSQEVDGACLRLTLPHDCSSDVIQRFEQILSQYAAYQDDNRSDTGTIELMDQTGQLLGSFQGNFTLQEDKSLAESGNEKLPVFIELPSTEALQQNEKQDVHVGLIPKGQAYQQRDWMLTGAELISKGIVRSSEYIGDKIRGAANSYTAKHPGFIDSSSSSSSIAADQGGNGEDTLLDSKSGANDSSLPSREPLKFSSTTQFSVRTLHHLSGTAVKISSTTTKAIHQVAGRMGDKIGKAAGIQRPINPDGSYGPPPVGIRGFINRSLIAANTILDGIDIGAQKLLYQSGDSASQVVAHKYGDQAKQLSQGVVKTGKNVFLVYKDLRGVRRSALLKVVGGHTIKAKLDDGREVILEVNQQHSEVTTSSSSSSKTGLPTSTSLPPPSHPSRAKSFDKSTKPKS